MDVSEITPVDIEKVQEENPQSRFRISNVAQLAPGVCALCGSPGGDGRQFVDFGKTMNWYGVVYFCTFCVAEVAALLGFAHRGLFDEEINALQNGCSERDLEALGLKEKLDAAMVLVRNCTCSDSGIGIPSLEISEADVIDDESADEDESDVDESDPVEGSDDISATSDSDDEPESKPARRARKSAG